MMKLPSWDNRPNITANLFNPAFCSEVIRVAAHAYQIKRKENMPFSLVILTLPMILSGKIRESIPNRRDSSIHKWINKNEEVRIGLSANINSYLPFVRESIMFGIVHNSFSLDENGCLDIKKRNSKDSKFKTTNEEVISCLKKSEILGALLSKSGSAYTIYSILGIKP